MIKRIIDYGKYIDAFEFVRDVKSHLVYDNDKVEKPFITIIIPTYKRYDLIRETLDSAINQQPVDFEWDIIVVDNEAYDGKENETTRIIKSFNCDRIRHYRHSRTTQLFDNHNLGIKLARGEWVMFLHDDDILFPNTLHKIGLAIKYLSKEKGKPLGGISTKYHLLKYDPKNPEETQKEIEKFKSIYTELPMSYRFEKLSQYNVLFTGHLGGDAPTNGSTFNRKAMIELGGYAVEQGDLVTMYRLQDKYSVYHTTEPYGFYRWGVNDSMAPGTTNIIINYFNDVREYVFSKNIFNKIFGCIFRRTLYDVFGECVLGMRAVATDNNIALEDYDKEGYRRANKYVRRFWEKVINKIYFKYKHHQTTLISRRIKERIEQDNLLTK